MKNSTLGYVYVSFALIAVGLVISPGIAEIWNSSPSILYVPIPSSLSGYFIRYINITTGSGSNLYLNITVPYSNTYYQNADISVLRGSGYSYHYGYNRTWMTFKIHSSTSIELKYSFYIKSLSYPVSYYTSLNSSYIPSYLKSRYLGDEYLYGNKVIMPEMFRNITEKIVGNSDNVFEEEKAIYDYIVKNFKYKLTYTLNNLPYSAWETYMLGEGDCVELSFLYISMARSIGIPAWLEFGWLYTTQTWAEHAWVGTVIPTKSGPVYGIVDLTEEVGTSDIGIGFFVRDPYRLTEWVDDGNSTHLTSYYTLLYGSTVGNFSPPVETIIPADEKFGQYTLLPLPSYSIDPFVFRIILVAFGAILFYYIVRRK